MDAFGIVLIVTFLLIFIAMYSVIPAYINYEEARYRNKDVKFWVFSGLLFSWLSVVTLYVFSTEKVRNQGALLLESKWPFSIHKNRAELLLDGTISYLLENQEFTINLAKIRKVTFIPVIFFPKTLLDLIFLDEVGKEHTLKNMTKSGGRAIHKIIENYPEIEKVYSKVAFGIMANSILRVGEYNE